MLSPQLLELLRDWWRIARPPMWMFPGRDRISPMTTRQLNRVCHMAAELASLPRWVAPHTLRHSFATQLEQNHRVVGGHQSAVIGPPALGIGPADHEGKPNSSVSWEGIGHTHTLAPASNRS